jgi:membrane protein CcdC involved in cytochrome C biogenesis
MAITNILITMYFIVTGLIVFVMACNSGTTWAVLSAITVMLGGVALLIDEVRTTGLEK